jgi:hypothetical protein
MKKHSSGFVPMNYKLAGKILLPIGVVMILVWLIDYFLQWGVIPLPMLYIGALDVLVSCYLIFLTPKE